MIKIIMLDIDGCVLMKGQTPKLKQIAFFQEYGRKVYNQEVPPLVFCTGRGAEYVQPLAQLLGIMSENELPSVVENGSYLYYPLTRRLTPHPGIIGKEKLIFEIKNFLVREVVFSGRSSLVPGKEGSVSLMPTKDKSNTAALASFVKEVMPEDLLRQFFISYSTTAVDVTLEGVSKGSVLSFYSDVTGIAVEEILMVGDANNDLPILKIAGTVACPSNATDDVKNLIRSRGGFIATQEGPSGVEEIINHYVI